MCFVCVCACVNTFILDVQCAVLIFKVQFNKSHWKNVANIDPTLNRQCGYLNTGS